MNRYIRRYERLSKLIFFPQHPRVLYLLSHPPPMVPLALDDRKGEFFRADERYSEEFASPCLPSVGSERECIVQRRYALLSSRRPAHTYTYNNARYTRVHRRCPLRTSPGASARTRCNFSQRRETAFPP